MEQTFFFFTASWFSSQIKNVIIDQIQENLLSFFFQRVSEKRLETNEDIEHVFYQK